MFVTQRLNIFYVFFFRLFPKLSNAIRPFLPVLSVLDTACCVGAPLALNINSVVSPFGATILLLVTMFHLSAFLSGYFVTGSVFRNAPDAKALQRTLSYETGNHKLNQLFWFFFNDLVFLKLLFVVVNNIHRNAE